MAEISQSGGDKSGKKRSKKASTKIDMTPMVDLGFLLITFFMLTTTLAKPVTMKLNMPDKDDKPNTDLPDIKVSESITVIPDSSSVYYFQGVAGAKETILEKTDYSNTGLRKLISQFKSHVGDSATIVIKAAKSAKYKNMVDMLDECVITGNKRYAIVDLDADTEKMLKESGAVAKQATSFTFKPLSQ